ncbi:ankyrin repeat-containing domain protein [Nemania sp. FL0031]|nr:ankyrin repeat-containing domain protein [Nemania sp. FL0031]
MEVEVVGSDHAGEGHFDLVAVHGLYGSSTETWGSSGSVTWLTEKLTAKSLKGRVLLYSYHDDSTTLERLSTRQAVRREALHLLGRIAKFRKDQDPPLPLVFVALDFGGIVVKEALIQASMNGSDFASIRACTRLLAFIGCPHRWKDAEDLESKITKFILSKDSSTFTPRQARALANTTTLVNNLFLQTRMLIQATVVNAYSTASAATGFFNQSTATFDVPMELRCGLDKSSNDLKEEQSREGFFNILERGLDRVTKLNAKPRAVPWINDAFSPLIDTIESHAAPVYPLETHFSPTHAYRWLEDDPTFQDWVSCRQCSILHIHGSPNITQAAEYGFHKTLSASEACQPNDHINLYFRFNKHDRRRDCPGTLAITFLAQILGRYRAPSSPQSPKFEPPLFSQCLTDQDAFFLLNSVRTDLGVEARMTWIVDGLDECDPAGSQWFLSQLLEIASHSDVYFKILITTVNDKLIRDTLAGAKCLEINTKGRGQLASPLDDNAPVANLCTRLLLDRPEFEPYSSKLRDIFQACGPDVDFARVMQDWFLVAKWTTKGSLEKALEKLSPDSPGELIKGVLQMVPHSARPWGRMVILWVLYSARPLNLGELASALSSGIDSTEYLDLMSAIRSAFGPLFATENNEIRFSRPWVREFFSSTEDVAEWYTQPTEEQGHGEIAIACIRYLSLPAISKLISVACRSPQHATILLDSRSDITSYAIQYWPSHYRRGYTTRNELLPPEDIIALLRDPKALQNLLSAHWHFCLPHLRATQSSSHHLSALSSFGLEREIGKAIASLSASAGQVGVVADALCEAARNGHRDIVISLLRLQDSLTSKDVLSALEAAACSGEYNVMRDLFLHLTSTYKAASYHWPRMILCRLAWAGEDSFLRDLLRCQDTSGLEASSEVPSKLYCAAAGGHASTISAILAHGADIDFREENHAGSTALRAVVRSGRDAAIRAFDRTSVAIDPKDHYGRTALEQATVFGQHQALTALLDAGAELTDVQCPLSSHEGWSSFTYASSASFETCIRILLERGANPDAQIGAPGLTALSSAARSGNLDICRLLLSHGAQVNGSDECRPLIQAFQSGRGKLELVRLLVDSGADVNLSQPDGTPLGIATKNGHRDIVEFLIGKEADVNATSGAWTPLYHSAREGQAEIAQLLITAGAHCRPEGDRRWTPLHMAWRHPECLKVLLDGGADIEASSVDSTALYLATYHGKLESVEVLISHGANLEVTSEFPGYSDSNYTPLLAAILMRRYEVIRALLKAGASVKARTPRNETVLHLAASKADEQAIKAILEYDPELDAKDEDGDTALHQAIYSETPVSLIELLVHRGASLNILGNDYIPLDLAIRNRLTEIAKYLISAKAELNRVGSFSGGPLHTACWILNFDMVKLLVTRGAKIDLMDPLRGTPLQVALVQTPRDATESASKEDIIRFLVDEVGADITVRGGLLSSALHAACLQGTPEWINVLVEKGGEVNAPDALGRRPIHHASFQTVKHIDQLLSLGADTGVKDKLGRTLLHTAVTSGRVDVVEKCLSITNGLINEPDNDGWTPLLWAVRSCDHWGTVSSNRATIIKLLLAEGANLRATGRCGHQEWSALKLARYYGASEEIVSLLTPKESMANENSQEKAWDRLSHQSRKAKFYDGYCDACLHSGYGLMYASKKHTLQTWLCCKCYTHRAEFFPEHDKWELVGDDEFDPESKEDAGEAEASKTEAGTPAPPKQVQVAEADYWSDSD